MDNFDFGCICLVSASPQQTRTEKDLLGENQIPANAILPRLGKLDG